MKKLLLFVLLGFAQSTLAQQTAADLAQAQLDAYNQRDLEAFLLPYADSVAVYTFPNQLQYRGKAEMRKVYGQMFQNLPDLHCTLVNRMVLGNTVIDQESVVFRKSEKPLQAIAIYKVKAGKITEVYFVLE
jgi:hypothetical protein